MFFTFVAITLKLNEAIFLNFAKKGNYKYINATQTFCSYIRYRSSMKLFLDPVPILPTLRGFGQGMRRNGTCMIKLR